LREVAAALKVDPSFLSRVEGGNKRATRGQVMELAEILREDAGKLLVLYLSERVVYELRDEDLAIEAIMAAEKFIRYKAKKPKNKKRQGRGK
jgi:hypothetical protein